MKIAIVSTPRTCSTLILRIHAQYYGIRNYSEIFSTKLEEAPTVEQKLDIVNGPGDFLVKLTPTSFLNNNITYWDVKWNTFDRIVFTQREDTLGQIASWLFLSSCQRAGIVDQREMKDLARFGNLSLLNTDWMPENVLYILDRWVYFYRELKPFVSSVVPLDKQTEIDYNVVQLGAEAVKQHLGMGEGFPSHLFSEHITFGNKTEIDYTRFIETFDVETLISVMIDKYL